MGGKWYTCHIPWGRKGISMRLKKGANPPFISHFNHVQSLPHTIYSLIMLTKWHHYGHDITEKQQDFFPKLIPGFNQSQSYEWKCCTESLIYSLHNIGHKNDLVQDIFIQCWTQTYWSAVLCLSYKKSNFIYWKLPFKTEKGRIVTAFILFT